MLMMPGIFWEYSVFHVLLGDAKASHNHRNCCCFEPPHSLNLDFQVFVYLLSFSVVLTEVLVLRGIVVSRRRQVLSFLFFRTMSGLLAALVLSVWMVMSHRIVTLSFLVTAPGSCSYHHSFTSMPNSLQIFQCVCAVVLLWRWMYLVLASSGYPETRWSIVSSKWPHSRFWVHVGILKDVVLVPACWEAIIIIIIIIVNDI